MSVPNYPFARERHPLPALKQPVALAYPKGLHPLLHENCSDLGGQRFRTVLSGKEFFLTDHRVHGRSLLPAMATLEMARVAFLHALPIEQALRVGEVVRIHDVVWLRPLWVEEAEQAQTLELKLLPCASGVEFEVYTNSL